MLDQELLDILVCPETKQPVHPADANLLSRVNEAVSHGTLQTRAGDSLAQPLDEALVREDGSLLYPVRDGIPIMLIDEGIALPESVSGG